MNCKNGAQFLRKAIDSIYRQTYTKWEIIFWDNGSTDNSASIAKSYDSRLRYFFARESASLGRSRGLAVAQAAGELIGFLDCDDVWLPRKLEKQVPLFTANSDVGIVFSDVVNYYQNDGYWHTQFSVMSHPPRGKIFNYLFLRYGVSMPTILLRKAALELDNSFDPAFHYSADYDLLLRLSYEWECDYVDEPLAIYRFHQSLCQMSYSRYEADERARAVEKICMLHPMLRTTQRRLIARIMKNISIVRAKWLWSDGQIAACRKELVRYAAHPKVMMILLLTLLPYSAVMKAWFRMHNARCGHRPVELEKMIKAYV
jgi:glycosyltransferase involved in cell wall biosynthesis